MTRAHPNLDNPKQASSQLDRQPAARKQILPAKQHMLQNLRNAPRQTIPLSAQQPLRHVVAGRANDP